MTSRILREVGEASSTMIRSRRRMLVPPSQIFLPPLFAVSTATIACLPHALLISAHQAHTPAHDALTAFDQEGERALTLTGEVMRAAGEGSLPLFGRPGRISQWWGKHRQTGNESGRFTS